MILYRVNAIKEFEYKDRKVSIGELIDVTPVEYLKQIQEGKIGQVVEIFDQRETAVKNRKVKK